MPLAKSEKFIIDYSKEIDDYPNIAASLLCAEFNKKSGQDSSKNTPCLADKPNLSWQI